MIELLFILEKCALTHLLLYTKAHNNLSSAGYCKYKKIPGIWPRFLFLLKCLVVHFQVGQADKPDNMPLEPNPELCLPFLRLLNHVCMGIMFTFEFASLDTWSPSQWPPWMCELNTATTGLSITLRILSSAMLPACTLVPTPIPRTPVLMTTNRILLRYPYYENNRWKSINTFANWKQGRHFQTMQLLKCSCIRCEKCTAGKENTLKRVEEKHFCYY
jgi:hypothetical protein